MYVLNTIRCSQKNFDGYRFREIILINYYHCYYDYIIIHLYYFQLYVKGIKVYFVYLIIKQ